MAIIVAFIFTKKNNNSINLSHKLFTKNGALYDIGRNIGWKKISANMMIYLHNILSITLNVKFKEIELIRLTEENLDSLVKISSKNNDIFINEISLAFMEFENYSVDLLIINKDDILDYLPEYDVSKYDLSNSFMLIESLSDKFDFSFIQASRLLIDMKKYS